MDLWLWNNALFWIERHYLKFSKKSSSLPCFTNQTFFNVDRSEFVHDITLPSFPVLIWRWSTHQGLSVTSGSRMTPVAFDRFIVLFKKTNDTEWISAIWVIISLALNWILTQDCIIINDIIVTIWETVAPPNCICLCLCVYLICPALYVGLHIQGL